MESRIEDCMCRFFLVYQEAEVDIYLPSFDRVVVLPERENHEAEIDAYMPGAVHPKPPLVVAHV